MSNLDTVTRNHILALAATILKSEAKMKPIRVRVPVLIDGDYPPDAQETVTLGALAEELRYQIEDMDEGHPMYRTLHRIQEALDQLSTIERVAPDGT